MSHNAWGIVAAVMVAALLVLTALATSFGSWYFVVGAVLAFIGYLYSLYKLNPTGFKKTLSYLKRPLSQKG